MEKLNYPIRINRYLALRKYCSRREADRLITAGQVKINGKKAILGDKVNARDAVEVNQKIAQKIAAKRVYFAFNKPRGLATQEIIKKYGPALRSLDEGGFPIGRLDKESHGLILLTNDGRATDRILNPEEEHEKEYLVQVDKKLRPFFLRHLAEGVNIEGYRTKPATVQAVNDTVFRITLTEGKKHQIRRMCAAFNYAVRDLKRVRIMNIELRDLSPGKVRKLAGKELQTLLSSLGL